MTAAHQDNGFAVLAAMAGGGLLFWLLLRHQQGLGLSGALGTGGGYSAGADAPSRTASSPARPERCHVRIDVTGLQLDGVAVDLPTLVARCRAIGAAEVFATGRAIEGRIGEVINALLGAGVRVWAEPSLWRATTVNTKAGNR